MSEVEIKTRSVYETTVCFSLIVFQDIVMLIPQMRCIIRTVLHETAPVTPNRCPEFKMAYTLQKVALILVTRTEEKGMLPLPLISPSQRWVIHLLLAVAQPCLHFFPHRHVMEIGLLFLSEDISFYKESSGNILATLAVEVDKAERLELWF